MIIEFKKKNFPLRTPFLLQHAKLLFLLGMLLIFISMRWVDQPFALWLHASRMGWDEWLTLWHAPFSPYFLLLIVPSLLFLCQFILKAELLSKHLWLVTCSLSLALLCSSLCSFCVGRSDPAWFFTHGEILYRPMQLHPSFQSFPSALSCSLGVLGSSLAYLYPKFGRQLLSISAIISCTPALSMSCFCSDALAGFAIGALVSLFAFRTMRRKMSFF